MLKKLTMLALSAAALVAFALPATASAGWTVNETALETNTEVEFTGHADFTVFNLVGATAILHIKVNLEKGSTGKVTGFTATECVGILGYKGNTCHVTTPTLAETPWVVHCNASGTISITEIDIHNKYTGASPPADSTLVGGVTATPDNNKTITTVTLSSNGANVGGNPANVTGDLAVVAPHTGVIGCV